MRVLISIILLISSWQASAAGVDFRVADKAAELFYLYKTSTFGYGGADVGWGYFFNEDDDQMISASLLVSGNSAGNNRSLQFGVGIKGYFADFDAADVEGGGLGIGGLLRFVFSSSTPVAILLEGYSVPQVTAFADAEHFNEYRFALEVEVTPSARAYIGFRNLTMELENGAEIELDDDAHVGVRLSF